MAKTTDEIKELLATDLFRKGIAKKYIVVNDDYTTIHYNCKNKTKRRLQNPEEFVQATSFLKLIFDYDYLPQNISVNESLQVGAETKEADILVYNEKNNKVLIVVECKEDGINERQFQVAVDQAYSYAHALAATYTWVTSGIKNEYFELSNLYPVERIAMIDIPKRDGEVQRYKYVKGAFEPPKGTQGELIQKFKSAHDALWGGGALAPTTAFDELDKLIFCKIWDERWDENNPRSKGEPYDFQIIYYSEDKEDKNNQKAKTELEKRIKALYEEGRKKDSEVFKDDIKLDRHKIFTVVQYLQDIHLSNTDLDAKGLAFQRFMGEFFRGDFGQFFTPNAIVQFIVQAIGVNKNYRVLDTSCGSGGFLIQALKAIREEANDVYAGRKDTNWFNYWHNFAQTHLFGIEINEQISRVAKMNMIIHDDGHTNIITNDGLKNNQTIEIENRTLNFQDGTFDLIMTNPPFGSTIKADEVEYYKEYELFENNKNKWRVSQSSEVLFLERCYKYLKEDGLLAIILPDGIITNSTNQYVRDWLLQKYRLCAVISLPQHTFSHVRAMVKSSVLILRKNSNDTVSKLHNSLDNINYKIGENKNTKEDIKKYILEEYKKESAAILRNYTAMFVDVQNIGYDSSGNPIDDNELPDVAKRVAAFLEGNVTNNRDIFVEYIDFVGKRLDPSVYRTSFTFKSNKYPLVSLSEVAYIDPSVTLSNLNKNDSISFIPMEAIDEEYGVIKALKEKNVSEVKGFTKFINNDLLWAKITPCMQNGKSAIARNLLNGVGCGSTEYFVIRPKESAKVLVKYLHFLLRDRRLLESAQNYFGGSAGQQRVSKDFLMELKIPLPPIEIQEQIIENLDESNNEIQRKLNEIERIKESVFYTIEHIIIG
ncbi:hypothetical protein AGMMS50239_19880 [Bacteroidia bacterium]|nr:hypothetical protein AGMMS50239_19880 [Bacteroidia bacterium]